MKPHFGQSDAAMNKRAGCNKFQNAGKNLELIAELEQKARDAGFKTPLEYLRSTHEEAAGMPLDERFYKQFTMKMKPAKNLTEFMTPDPLPEGYYGHEAGCDCAVCENMMLGEARRNREAKHRENILRLAELVIAAYFRGWKDGSETGESDSPDWNAAEDWMGTDIRAELTKIEAALEI